MLKYIGEGKFLLGVPARDLSEEETKVYGLEQLVASGIYQEEKAVKSSSENKGLKPSMENKEK